jgi:hypothetical protein
MEALPQVVFLGWPGQQAQEEQAPQFTLDAQVLANFCHPALAAAAVAGGLSGQEQERLLRSRQLGYVSVSRPVRQGRLKLALEEVGACASPVASAGSCCDS